MKNFTYVKEQEAGAKPRYFVKIKTVKGIERGMRCTTEKEAQILCEVLKEKHLIRRLEAHQTALDKAWKDIIAHGKRTGRVDDWGNTIKAYITDDGETTQYYSERGDFLC